MKSAPDDQFTWFWLKKKESEQQKSSQYMLSLSVVVVVFICLVCLLFVTLKTSIMLDKLQPKNNK